MTEQPANPTRWTVPGAIFSCFLWSTAFVGIKIGLRHVPPLTFAGWRFMLAGALLLPFWGRPGPAIASIRRNWRLVATVGVLQTAVLYGAFFFGMQWIGGAQAAILLGTYPLIVSLIAHFATPDDRMTAGKWLAILLGMGGVAIIATATKPWEPAGLKQLGGMALVLASICSSAAANVIVSRKGGVMKPTLLTSAQIGLGGIVLFVAAMVFEGPPQTVPTGEFFAVLVYLAFVSAAGFSIWYALLRRAKVSRLNMWKFVIPVFGACLSWLLLPDESPNISSVIGMCCVASAVLIGHRQTTIPAPGTA